MSEQSAHHNDKQPKANRLHRLARNLGDRVIERIVSAPARQRRQLQPVERQTVPAAPEKVVPRTISQSVYLLPNGAEHNLPDVPTRIDTEESKQKYKQLKSLASAAELIAMLECHEYAMGNPEPLAELTSHLEAFAAVGDEELMAMARREPLVPQPRQHVEGLENRGPAAFSVEDKVQERSLVVFADSYMIVDKDGEELGEGTTPELVTLMREWIPYEGPESLKADLQQYPVELGSIDLSDVRG